MTVHRLSANIMSKPQKDRVKCVARKAVYRLIIDSMFFRIKEAIPFNQATCCFKILAARGDLGVRKYMWHIIPYLLYLQRSKLIITSGSANFETLGYTR